MSFGKKKQAISGSFFLFYSCSTFRCCIRKIVHILLRTTYCCIYTNCYLGLESLPVSLSPLFLVFLRKTGCGWLLCLITDVSGIEWHRMTDDSRKIDGQSRSHDDDQGQRLRLDNGISWLPHLNVALYFRSLRKWKGTTVSEISFHNVLEWFDVIEVVFTSVTKTRILSSSGLCTLFPSKRQNLLVSAWGCCECWQRAVMLFQVGDVLSAM